MTDDIAHCVKVDDSTKPPQPRLSCSKVDMFEVKANGGGGRLSVADQRQVFEKVAVNYARSLEPGASVVLVFVVAVL